MVFKSIYSDDEILAVLSSEWCTAAHIRSTCGIKSSSSAKYILLKLAAEGKVEMKEFNGIGCMYRLKTE